MRTVTKLFIVNDLWLFITLLLFVSYFLLLFGGGNTYLDYIQNFLTLSIIFSPVLLFVGVRNKITEKLPFIALAIIWVFCFILYPIIIYQCMTYNYNGWLEIWYLPSKLPSPQDIWLYVGAGLLLTELIVQTNEFLIHILQKRFVFQFMGLETILLSFILLIALVFAIAVTFNIRDTEMLNGISPTLGRTILNMFLNTIQLFILGLTYYFFYALNHYLLIPYILKPKGVIYYAFSIASVILLFYPIFVFIIRQMPIVHELNTFSFIRSNIVFAEDGGFIPFIIMTLSLPIIVSNQWFRQHHRLATLENEKTATELNLLKQQINPHFFFNTLNNLYALSLIKHDQTPKVILQLSEMMSYVIYKGQESTVMLSEELKYIEDYIDLQMIRIHKPFDYQFEKKIINFNQSVPPLLFIIFVENAFKHGIEPAGGNCYLYLTMKNESNTIEFTCRNSVEEIQSNSRGIGLYNLRKRLELQFPDQYELDIVHSDCEFTARLKLYL